jgi:hypothetical protein
MFKVFLKFSMFNILKPKNKMFLLDENNNYILDENGNYLIV